MLYCRMGSDTTAAIVLAENVRRFRHLSGLTQEALAERVGLTAQSVSAIERCKRNVALDVLVRLADAFGVSVAELFTPYGQSQLVDLVRAARDGSRTPEES